MERTIRIPPRLYAATEEDDYEERRRWLERLPAIVEQLALEWQLELADPYLPGGQCAWVAPAAGPDENRLVLKVGWRHREAEHEADALRFWDGDGAVRCYASRSLDDTTALLLERAMPGIPLNALRSEEDQDVVVAGLMLRLWEHRLFAAHPFRALEELCGGWAESFELGLQAFPDRIDAGLAREALSIFRMLPTSADRRVLLCTDLHAGNIVAASREPWLLIDPKPYVGDPAYDPVQHMLNCDDRLARDPAGMADRMAGLLGLDAVRVRQWLFARCAQESLFDDSMREPARRLAP